LSFARRQKRNLPIIRFQFAQVRTIGTDERCVVMEVMTMAQQRLQTRTVHVTCPNCRSAIEVRNPERIREDFGVKCEVCGKRSIFHVKDIR
jgi:DNA-directed RNA polymerase subunit RPC12/RpoP